MWNRTSNGRRPFRGSARSIQACHTQRVDIELLGQGIIAALGITALVIQGWRARGAANRRRMLIKHDVEIVNLLPTDSKARATLMGHVENTIEQLIIYETVGRRDWLTMASGGFLFIGGAGVGISSAALLLQGQGTQYLLGATSGTVAAIWGWTLFKRAYPKVERGPFGIGRAEKPETKGVDKGNHR